DAEGLKDDERHLRIETVLLGREVAVGEVPDPAEPVVDCLGMEVEAFGGPAEAAILGKIDLECGDQLGRVLSVIFHRWSEDLTGEFDQLATVSWRQQKAQDSEVVEESDG